MNQCASATSISLFITEVFRLRIAQLLKTEAKRSVYCFHLWGDSIHCSYIVFLGGIMSHFYSCLGVFTSIPPLTACEYNAPESSRINHKFLTVPVLNPVLLSVTYFWPWTAFSKSCTYEKSRHRRVTQKGPERE